MTASLFCPVCPDIENSKLKPILVDTSKERKDLVEILTEANKDLREQVSFK